MPQRKKKTGWWNTFCPYQSLLRLFGYKTADEIEAEQRNAAAGQAAAAPQVVA